MHKGLNFYDADTGAFGFSNGEFKNFRTNEFFKVEFLDEVVLGANGRSNIEGYDFNLAVETLNNNAFSKYIAGKCGYCARAVRTALEGGGLDTTGRPGSAKDYIDFLPELGFNEINKEDYEPITGDIIVIQSFKTHIHGHIQMYDGEDWVSDFVQSGLWPGSAYRKEKPNFNIFR